MTEAEAREQASRVATGAGFTERLAERVGATARASAVFGDAVEREGVTVIPVARAKWGFGGGSGGREGEEGSGGGGGTSVSPIGYIELRAGGARFRRINSSLKIVVALVAAVACGLSALFALGIARTGLRALTAGRSKGRSGRLRLVSALGWSVLRARRGHRS
jgi:uncharacterized spore protein YtfJ